MYDYDKAILAVSASDIRAINRTSILELIRCHGPISRTEVAQRLRLSLPTVMRIVDELIHENLVRSANRKQWSGGRKRDLVEFNGSEHLVIALDMGGTKFFGAVATISGEILFENYFQHGQTEAEASYLALCEALEQLIQQARSTGYPILGLAIGVPGMIDPQTGVVSLAPSVNWQDFPLKQRLGEKFSFPITIENDVNLAVLGEFWFGTEPGEENVVLMAIGTGIGAGIVINGMLYTGAHQIAGEVGYLLPTPKDLDRSFPDFGAFEQIASGPGIAARAQAVLSSQEDAHQRTSITAEEVFQAARNGEQWAIQILDETVDVLAQAIASITLIVDPHVILLGGGVSRSADLLLEPILARLRGSIPITPRLAASRLGYRAAVLGGVARILRSSASYSAVQRF